MKRSIVITSIFSPTVAVQKFSSLGNLIVVGDRKTPSGWSFPGVSFLGAEEQEKLPFQLSQKLPWNHYCRKMLGYLWAMRENSSQIVDTDDDNIPYDDWSFPEFDGTFKTSDESLGYVNIYVPYTDDHIWPRGLPLDEIASSFDRSRKQLSQLKVRDVSVGIWQGFADREPDVDAICRLVGMKEVTFKKTSEIVLGSGTISPFNSQNTLFRKEVFPLLYLPTSVSFRFTDILRGIVAQPILWNLELKLGFTSASVFQDRNQHNLMKDFLDEATMYSQSKLAFDVTLETAKKTDSLSDQILKTYQALLKVGVVKESELETLEAWLNDCQEMRKK